MLLYNAISNSLIWYKLLFPGKPVESKTISVSLEASSHAEVMCEDYLDTPIHHCLWSGIRPYRWLNWCNVECCTGFEPTQCDIAPQRYCATAPLLYHYCASMAPLLTPLLRHYCGITPSLRYCLTASLRHCATASLRHRATAHCVTTPLRHIHMQPCSCNFGSSLLHLCHPTRKILIIYYTYTPPHQYQ